MMMVDTGTPRNPNPYEPFLWWALLLGSAYFALYMMRSCAESLT